MEARTYFVCLCVFLHHHLDGCNPCRIYLLSEYFSLSDLSSLFVLVMILFDLLIDEVILLECGSNMHKTTNVYMPLYNVRANLTLWKTQD